MEFDFEKNGTVENLDDVPQKYQGLYVESDGKFVISDAAKGLVTDYIGTAKALGGARNDKKAANDESAKRRTALKAFDDLAETLGLEVGDDGVAPALSNFIEELQGQVKGGKQLKVDLDKIKADFDRRLNEGLAAKDKDIAERDSALSKYLISQTATAALAKHKGSVDLLLPHVQSRTEVVREENGDYTVRVKDNEGSHRMNGSGGWMGVEELVTEMKSQDAFARAFESEAPGGTGSPPGGLRQQAPRQQTQLSATQKIAAGLKKGQHVHGAGA